MDYHESITYTLCSISSNDCTTHFSATMQGHAYTHIHMDIGREKALQATSYLMMMDGENFTY